MENNGCSYCYSQVISVTWSWSSLTPWVRLSASAPSTLWKAWMRNTGTDCVFTWARLTRPGESPTDRYEQQQQLSLKVCALRMSPLFSVWIVQSCCLVSLLMQVGKCVQVQNTQVNGQEEATTVPALSSWFNSLSFCAWLSQRVMMQIVQELCKRPGLNKCGFDMPTIYIPNPNKVRVVLSVSSRWFSVPLPP